MFNGMGNGWVALVTNMISAVFIRVPAALLYARVFDMGLLGIGLAIPTATCAAAVVAFVFYRIGVWRKLRITS